MDYKYVYYTKQGINMTEYNADLHMHSPYAGGVSKNMSIPLLSKEAKIKGLNILSTSDIFFSKWADHVKENVAEKDGIFTYKEDVAKKNDAEKIHFIVGNEVEVSGRVHFLIYFRDFEQVEQLKKIVAKYSKDINIPGGGRPRFSLTPQEFVDHCVDQDILIGPAHGFTPYFGIYSHYNNLKDAIGPNWKKIKFMELGLSADTNSANIIPDLEQIKFFSFSDSHSPYSYRIGREFVRMELEEPSFDFLKKLVENDKKNKILFNIGFDPKEGMYNRTACRDCGQIYLPEQARNYNYKCVLCKGLIKKGVHDRIQEIAEVQGNNEKRQITERPEYKHLIPLAQIIQTILKKKNMLNKEVMNKYNEFTKEDNEINVMLNMPEKQLIEIDKNIAKGIISFRENLIVFKPGGGGFYGVPHICYSEKEKKEKQVEIDEACRLKTLQKTINQF